MEPDASVNKFSLLELHQLSSRKEDMPLKEDKNDNQTRNLLNTLTSWRSRMKWCGSVAPRVRSIRRRKNARPGAITEQAKFNKPIKDWSSLSVTFLRCKKVEINWTHFAILSFGRRASDLMESNSMPANVRVVAGPQVCSGAMGMPRLLHNIRNRSKSPWHWVLVEEIKRKSSNKWRSLSILRLCRAIHSMAVLKVWNVLHEIKPEIKVG